MHQKLLNRRQNSHQTAHIQKQPSPMKVRYLTSTTEGEDPQPAAASLGLSPTKFGRA